MKGELTMKMIYKTMDKSHKNYVILNHDTENDMYYVVCSYRGIVNKWEYSHFNHATFKFDLIHKKLLEEFKENVLTNLR
jgi:hypothetical protein